MGCVPGLWRRTRLALVLVLASACARPFGVDGSASAARSSETGVNAAEQSEFYETVSTPLGARGDAADASFAAAVERACNAASLELDGRLADVANATARSSHGALRAPTYASLNHHAHRVGLVEPTPEVWLASGPDTRSLEASIEKAVSDLARSSSSLTHCGAAAVRAKHGVVVAIALSRRHASLSERIPKQVSVGDSIDLEGELARGYSQPTLALTAPTGEVSRKPLGASRRVHHTLRLTQRGEYTIELLAQGPDGVAVVAVFPVAVGITPNRNEPNEEDAPVEASADEVVRRLTQLIAEQRERRGLRALKIDARLARVALAHSEDMVRNDFIAHTSKSTGDAVDRVAYAGLKALIVLENIGRGYSAQEIHRGLMESPGHRANILHEDARELGIGVVAAREGARVAFIATQLFTRLARETDARGTRDGIVEGIARQRRKRGVASARIDDRLSSVAQRAAERFARGAGNDENELLEGATREVGKAPEGVRALTAALVLADDAEQVWSSPPLLDPNAVRLGIGVAELGAAKSHSFAVVLLIGTK